MDHHSKGSATPREKSKLLPTSQHWKESTQKRRNCLPEILQTGGAIPIISDPFSSRPQIYDLHRFPSPILATTTRFMVVPKFRIRFKSRTAGPPGRKRAKKSKGGGGKKKGRKIPSRTSLGNLSCPYALVFDAAARHVLRRSTISGTASRLFRLARGLEKLRKKFFF